ncbi:hypothetical protein P4B35_04450 [Pontiellaceae bacterium B12227]|nr:hypothetical protein [Pontiellaceae bacterium B12227]
MLWDLIQQMQISEHQENTFSLERRVQKLEKELHATRESLLNLTRVLETKFGEGMDDVPDRVEGELMPKYAKAHVKRPNTLQTRNQLLKQQIQRAKQRKHK